MESIVARLDAKIAERSLLKHPFYQAWDQGKLTIGDIILYAPQYAFFEDEFSRFLSGLHWCCPNRSGRKTILDNLWDEEGGREDHFALWLIFCKALGLNDRDMVSAGMYPETIDLIQTYSRLCHPMYSSLPEGLAAIYAYEKQVPEIARVKMGGLRQFYGITDEKALKFFVVHSELDREHSLREAEALERHVAPDDIRLVGFIEAAADRTLDAWWRFLDGIENRRVKN